MSATAGSGSSSTAMSASASSAMWRLSAMTTASGSPTCRTLSPGERHLGALVERDAGIGGGGTSRGPGCQ
jgi:hypothetical protein